MRNKTKGTLTGCSCCQLPQMPHWCVFALELSPWKMSLYVEIASKQHLTPIAAAAAAATFSNDWPNPDVFYWRECYFCARLYPIVYNFVFSCFFGVFVLWCIFMLAGAKLPNIQLISVSNLSVSCCALLLCPDNQQDADRSTASHPEIRRALSPNKKEP